MTYVRVEKEIAGRKLVLETGKMAKQSDGAVVATYGDTVVFCAVNTADPREGIDFFPLTVDYREKTFAAGKIPGGFFKREGRPTAREILTMRIIDRSIRPLFPAGYNDEVQVMAAALSTDQENDPDWLAMTAAFAALSVSSIPFEGPLGSCRVGMLGDDLVLNPTHLQLYSPESKLNLTVAGSTENVVMVEAGADNLSEKRMLEALEMAQGGCREVCELIKELVEKAGKQKQEVAPVEKNEDLVGKIKQSYFDKIKDAHRTVGKLERKNALSAVKKDVVEEYGLGDDADKADASARVKEIKGIYQEVVDLAEREMILTGTRVDGRKWHEIRQIDVEVGVLPRVHGSVLFTRGETQALVTATLGTGRDEQIIDGLFPEIRKRFILHYNFPPYCVGEVKPIRGTSRREIGHGALAERSLEPVFPPVEKFPYTVRVVSDIMESNGSSSMASVCGGCLSMMDAGVPLKNPIAGIAMGLVMEGDKVAVLSDILGSEDHSGDMDFKVAGSQNGITSLQMDIKCKGLTRELMEKALDQAREGRVSILKTMLSALRKPRGDISVHAPRLETIQINPEKIGRIIGPGGSNIRSLQEETDTVIEVDDSGLVKIAGLGKESVEKCKAMIQETTAEAEVGKVYQGRVVSVKDFGAFIEILPGQEGLCHVSELSNSFVRQVTDVVRIGDKVETKVINVDDHGKIKLSIKALEEKPDDESEE